eukprot:2323240-Prymnesium_polylepis.1
MMRASPLSFTSRTTSWDATLRLVTPTTTHVTMKAYGQQFASKYLPRPLESYLTYDVPSTKALFKAYETAMKREHTPAAALCSSYASKVGAMIFAAPAARFECAYSIGICARCLTFPTPEMDECAASAPTGSYATWRSTPTMAS